MSGRTLLDLLEEEEEEEEEEKVRTGHKAHTVVVLVEEEVEGWDINGSKHFPWLEEELIISSSSSSSLPWIIVDISFRETINMLSIAEMNFALFPQTDKVSCTS